MDRRTAIGTGITAVGSVALAGCAGLASRLGGDADPPGDLTPEEAVEAFLNAVEAGDGDAAEALVHPDGELVDRVGEYVDAGDPIEFDSIRTAVTDREGGRTFVDTEGIGRDEAGNEVTIDSVYELRIDDGEWRLYADRGSVPLQFRLRDVEPAGSYEATIGRSRETAEPFFDATDVAKVGLDERRGTPVVTVSFASDAAEAIQSTAAALGGALSEAAVYQYLSGEFLSSVPMSPGLAELLRSARWAAAPELTMSFEDRATAERVAATFLAAPEE